MNDYTPITSEDESAGSFLGTWWRQPPHVIQRGTFAPYRGEGRRPVTVQGDVLVPTGRRAERYDPLEKYGHLGKSELLDALLKVARGDLKPVGFADRFGLLGYNYLVPEEYRCKGGDPLDWFLAVARTAHTIAELISRLNEARESKGGRTFLAEYLREEIPNGPHALGGWVAQIRFQQAPSNPILVANGILRYLLNANLGQAGRRLQSTKRGGLRTIFTFRSLTEVVYWELADQIGETSIHRCRECGRIFTHSNTRALFCPPVQGITISRCKSRYNVRKSRKQRRRKR